VRTNDLRGCVVVAVAIATLAVAVSGTSAAVTFSGVGALGSAGSRINAMAPDGTIVVGESTNNANETEAFIWSTTDGLHALDFPTIPPPLPTTYYSVATGVDVNSNNEVKIAVTGQRDWSPDPYEYQAFLWTGNRAGVGTYDVENWILFGGGFASVSAGLAVQSSNGAVMMTGHAKASDWAGPSCENWHGFLWSAPSSMQDLGKAFGGSYPVYGRGISPNGRVVGQLQNGSTTPCAGTRRAFLWNASTLILFPLGTADEDLANAISRDGEYVAGARITAGVSKAILGRARFVVATPTPTVQEIPYLAGDDSAEALCLSGQGELVGGRSSAGGGPSRAFVWESATNQTRDVKAWLLSTHGVDVAAQGWSSLTEVTGISADGSAIAGNGVHNGKTEGWVVRGLPIYPPVIDQVTPDPDITDQGVEYKRQLHLAKGMFTAVTWAKVAGPTGLAVDPQTGFVYGWTPTVSDVGLTYGITISATNAAGTTTESWSVTVANQGPGPGGSATGVAPPLYPSNTAITVKGITATGDTSRVTLYRIRDGVETVLAYADETNPQTLFIDGVHDFPVNPGDLQVGDVIQATQTRDGVESWRSWSRVVLQPIPSPQTPPHTFWGFSDDFESSPVKLFWQLEEPMTLTSVQSRGVQSLLEDAVSGGRMAMDAAPGNYQQSTQDRNPVLFEFWMYEEGVPPYTGSYARHVGGIQECAGGGYNVGTVNWLFEIGLLPTVRVPAKQASDPTKYNYRCVQAVSGSRNVSGNMDQPGCPLRSPGWHRFSIKIAANKVYYYVDGILGHIEANTNPKITSGYLGTWSGNTGTVSTGGTIEPTVVTLDGHTAYYDDVSLRQITNHLPVLDVTTINVTEGQPVSVAITATDTDTPDLVTLQYLSGTLPTGLGLSNPMAKGSPTATIVLQGTPAAGTAGTYTVNFQAQDDLPAGTITGPVTIHVSACGAPPVVSAISPSVGVEGRSNLRSHPPYDGVAVPTGPVHATITGSGFAAGATVKLKQSGKPDLVATNVVVVSETQITCDIDLGGVEPGSLAGVWDVVVSTCADSAVPSPAQFTVSMCFVPAQDTDGDGDVDLGDFSVFQNCFNGPNRPYKLPAGYNKECYCLDQGDNPVVRDVDLADFNAFQGCFNGPNRPPKGGC